MPKSPERRELEKARRKEERRKSEIRNGQRQVAAMIIDEDTGQIMDDNWISLGYRGKRR